MADYLHENDGKIHTRYSELIRCTPGQIQQVVMERMGAARYEGDGMLFGTDRHAMWEEYGKEHGRTPECFDEILPGGLPLSHVEEEFATEMLPGVVVHSRPDGVAAAAEALIDYKTVKDGLAGWQKNIAKYRTSRQMTFYTFQLGLHNIRIRKGLYLCEIWNDKQTEIIDYALVKQDYSFSEVAKVLPWIKERIDCLVTGVQDYERRVASLKY